LDRSIPIFFNMVMGIVGVRVAGHRWVGGGQEWMFDAFVTISCFNTTKLLLTMCTEMWDLRWMWNERHCG
jgi:hypothetical protein